MDARSSCVDSSKLTVRSMYPSAPSACADLHPGDSRDYPGATREYPALGVNVMSV